MADPDIKTTLMAQSCSALKNIQNVPKINGNIYSDNVLPNNNSCESVLSPEYVINKQGITEFKSNINQTEESEDCSTMEKEDSDIYSFNKLDDTYLTNEDSTSEDQNIKAQLLNQYEPLEHNNMDFNDKLYQKNGVLKKNSKKKKISSGPGRGRPRKGLVAMYHSQISGDKNTIKLRIKKSNFMSQVSS